MTTEQKANSIIENNIDKNSHINICKNNALKEAERGIRLAKDEDENIFFIDVLSHLIKSKPTHK